MFTKLQRYLIILFCCGCFFWGFASVIMGGAPANVYGQHGVNIQTIELKPKPTLTPTPTSTPTPTPSPTPSPSPTATIVPTPTPGTTGGTTGGGSGATFFIFMLGGLGMVMIVSGFIVYVVYSRKT